MLGAAGAFWQRAEILLDQRQSVGQVDISDNGDFNRGAAKAFEPGLAFLDRKRFDVLSGQGHLAGVSARGEFAPGLAGFGRWHALSLLDILKRAQFPIGEGGLLDDAVGEQSVSELKA